MLLSRRIGVYAALQKATPQPLTVLTQSAAEDKDAIVVTKATADKYKLTSITDLAPVAKAILREAARPNF